MTSGDALPGSVRRCGAPGNRWCYGIPVKPMTIRLNDDQAGALDQLAGVEGVPAAEIVRRALRLYTRAQRDDPTFQARLRHRIQADQDALRHPEGQPA